MEIKPASFVRTARHGRCFFHASINARAGVAPRRGATVKRRAREDFAPCAGEELWNHPANDATCTFVRDTA